MPVIVTPVRASHLVTLRPAVPLAQALQIEQGFGESAWSPSGRLLACYGILVPTPGRGSLWVVLRERNAPPQVALVRTMRRFLRTTWQREAFRRLDMLVNPDDAPAVRFVQWLGFRWEARFEAYGLQGEAMEQYCWVREEKERVV